MKKHITTTSNAPSTPPHYKINGLEVVSTELLTPHIRRIIFSGKSLESYATMENLHVRLLFPPQEADKKHWLDIDDNGYAIPLQTGTKPLLRKYTIRSIDLVTNQIVIDFVIHDDGGPGSTWAFTAKPADIVGMIGPGGRGYKAAQWSLYAGDETALPAIARILEYMPDHARGLALIEVDNASEKVHLQAPTQFEIRWLYRHGVEAGTTTLLQQAIENIEWPDDKTEVFVWVGAEFDTANNIRQYLTDVHELGKEKQLVVSYWRRGHEDRN